MAKTVKKTAVVKKPMVKKIEKMVDPTQPPLKRGGEKKESNLRSIATLAVTMAVVFGLAQMCSNRDNMRLSKLQEDNISQRLNQTVNKLEQNAGELGYYSALEKMQEENSQKLQQFGKQKQAMAASAFLGAEYKHYASYELFCKDYGLKAMPNLREQVLKKNKENHDLAMKILKKEGMGQVEGMIKDLLDRNPDAVKKGVLLEFEDVSADTDKDFSEICKEIEATAANNDYIVIENSFPEIVKAMKDGK